MFVKVENQYHTSPNIWYY